MLVRGKGLGVGTFLCIGVWESGDEDTLLVYSEVQWKVLRSI